MLHKKEIAGATVGGANYTWCEACHNDTADWAFSGYPYPAAGIEAARPERDEQGYPVLGTFPGSGTYNNTLTNAHNPTTSTNVVWPDSGLLSGDCRNCHTTHGSDAHGGLRASYRPTPDASSTAGDLANGTYAELCFTCHDNDGPATTNIKQFATFEATSTAGTGGHRISTGGGTLPAGAPLPCYDCHNPHGSKGNDGSNPNKQLLSDEHWSGIDTSTTAGVVGFCMKCHLSAEDVAAGAVPTGELTHIEGLSRTDAANKLSLVPGVEAHSRANADNPTISCYDCHGGDYSAPSATSGFNVHRPASLGSGLSGPTGGTISSCLACHSGPVGSGTTARRAVAGEFSAAGHHLPGTVTDSDCGVCHLEASPADGARNEAVHANQAIDLRDPDTGGPLAAIAKMSRDRTSAALEPEVIAVQNGLCLGCHDADGAASPEARVSTGTALRPFSAGQVDASNLMGALDPTNAFHHAVLQAGSNPHTTSSAASGNQITMEPPWNQAPEQHDIVSCFDCHEASAGHGAANEASGRTDFSTTQGLRDLCVSCHKATVYEGSSGASGFPRHGESRHRTDRGCRGCHGGTSAQAGLNSMHGGNFLFPSGASDYFISGGYIADWQPGSCTPTCHGQKSY